MKVVSCPGKILLAGGYAILNQSNHGISVAVNQRYYTSAIDSEEMSIYSQQFNKTWKKNNCGDNQFMKALFEQVQGQQPKAIRIINDKLFFSEQGSETKTGLGSSACLIVSVLGQYYKESLLDLANRVNHKAQKKIGSGFDISTAIMGTQLFSINEIRPLKLQKPLYDNIILIDLSQGQSTTQSVKNVKQYFQSNPTEYKQFLHQSEQHVMDLYEYLTNIKTDTGHLKQSNYLYRSILKRLGNKAGFEIEPDVATEILDYLMKMRNILWAISPGAGGYDAIAALIGPDDLSDEEKLKLYNYINTKGGKVHYLSFDDGLKINDSSNSDKTQKII